MKAMILAIRLKYFYLTYKGIKTTEIRKTCPKNFEGDVYEYVSKTNFEKELLEIPENEREFFKQFKGKIGLKFTLRKAEEIIKGYTQGETMFDWTEGLRTETIKDFELLEKSCLTKDELYDYLDYYTKKTHYGFVYHIEDLVIFDKPKELLQFEKFGSWRNYQETCKKALAGRCNYGWGRNGKIGCEKARLTKAPQNFCYVESEE